MTAPIIPGAEPFSADGGPHGALVLHGFTGNPGSMRGLAEALAAAGFTVELPLLPGHGTTVEDMIPTGWADWSAAPRRRTGSSRARCEQVVVAGLSMGGTLTSWLAAEHPEIAGIVCINAVVTAAGGDGRGACRRCSTQGQETMAGHRVRHRRPRRRSSSPTRRRRSVRCSRCSRPATSFAERLGRHPLPGARHDQPAGPRGAAGEQRPPRRAASPARSSGSPSSAATTSPPSTTTRTSSRRRPSSSSSASLRTTGRCGQPTSYAETGLGGGGAVLR